MPVWVPSLSLNLVCVCVSVGFPYIFTYSIWLFSLANLPLVYLVIRPVEKTLIYSILLLDQPKEP